MAGGGTGDDDGPSPQNLLPIKLKMKSARGDSRVPRMVTPHSYHRCTLSGDMSRKCYRVDLVRSHSEEL